MWILRLDRDFEQSKLGQVDDCNYMFFKLLPISKFDVLSSYPITAIADMTDIDQFKTFNLKLTHVSHQRIFCNYNQY